MDTELKEIGDDLVYASRSEETSARGLVTELFPFIAVAARRMSARSISRYLQERHGVKISAVTIAKALREPAKHLEPFAEEVEVAARRVAEAHGYSIEGLLQLDPRLFDTITHDEPPTITGLGDDELNREHDAYKQAVYFLTWNWFNADAQVRSVAMDFIGPSDDESNANAENESK
jgi:hypothetical protein